jgi:PadR family transcriptional regulator, regulatory protein PadR
LTERVQYIMITLSDSILCGRVLSVGRGGTLIRSDIIRGHLDSIILRLIMEKDRYGYEISKEISQRTDERFQIKEATLYAVFQRLEKKELIESYFGSESKGGKRKYYRITTLGKAYFKETVEEWEETKEIMNIFMEGFN